MDHLDAQCREQPECYPVIVFAYDVFYQQSSEPPDKRHQPLEKSQRESNFYSIPEYDFFFYQPAGN